MQRLVLLVDDEPLARLGLRALIEAAPDLEVCGEARTTAEARALLAQRRPDLVILDIAIEGDRGLDFIMELHATPSAQSLVCSRREETIYAKRCLRAGARGYMSKRAPVESVLGSIRQVLEGHLALGPRVQRSLVNGEHTLPDPVDPAEVDALSDRELEVLELLGEGYATKDIAATLGLNLKTVQTYCAQIKRKLHLGDHNQLIRRAVHYVLEGQ